ncbi:MAG: putative polymerase ECF-subfamily sigma factor [Actinomycetia bacterium]|nr:putative polymerase ECF-subfamily sigma factor [Actinomycetes bacterium]
MKLETRDAKDHDVTCPDVEDHTASFGLFYRSERDGLFASLCLITRDPHEAEELMHDAFLKVWERWGRVRDMDRPAGYLYRTAINAFRTRYRRTMIAKRVLERTSERDLLDDVEGRDRLDRALAALTVRQRAAVILTELLDYTSEEAGRLLGVRPGTVRGLAHHGRVALRKTM